MAERITYDGVMAARIDRLPLTRVQWQLAVLVEVTWGFIIFDTDGIGARLYPFVWRPNHIIDVVQYAVIQALQVGLGILLGVYMALRLRHRFRLDGRAVRPQHPRRRRHRGDPLGLPVRDDPRPTCATGCC
jgi:hypothetical protein